MRDLDLPSDFLLAHIQAYNAIYDTYEGAGR